MLSMPCGNCNRGIVLGQVCPRCNGTMYEQREVAPESKKDSLIQRTIAKVRKASKKRVKK